MNIAIATPYGDYYNKDRFFDVSACKLGENILVPNILLKKQFESLGHNYHTIDMYDINDIDVAIFQDIPSSTYYARNFIKKIYYMLRKGYKKDYIYQVMRAKKKIKKILIIQEPPVVMPSSYNMSLHEYFDAIFTWKDDLIDNKKYFKFLYPQPRSNKKFDVPFSNKKLLTMICGNKKSKQDGELYSKRRDIIDFLDKSPNFDLYGINWEKENLACYKGSIESKLDVLSEYKFSIAFENFLSPYSYITEKIFDCFFANVVPIYYGSQVIDRYIPQNCFIDYRNFLNDAQMMNYLQNITEKAYNNYIINIQNYLNSDSFNKNFSVSAYVNNLMKSIC